LCGIVPPNVAPLDHANAREALAFLIASGCDVPVAPTPRRWLEEAPAVAPPLAELAAAAAPHPPARDAAVREPAALHPALACTDVPALLTLLGRFPAARQQPPLLFHGNLDAGIWVLIDRPDADPAHRETIDRMLAAIDLDWSRAALVSRLAFPTPGDSEPTPDLLARFTPVLERLAVLAPPTLVLALGQVAAEMAGSTARLASSRGRWFDWAGARLLPSIHPRTMNSKDLKAQAFLHLKTFRAEIA
jgi:uracil-DNA glycosylase